MRNLFRRPDALSGAINRGVGIYAEADAVLETTLEAFIAIELSGEIVTWNNASERTFGWLGREAVGKQIETLQDWKAGLDQRDELLVEDQEFFEIELLAPARADAQCLHGSGRLDRIDEKALLGITFAQFTFGCRFGDLLLDLAARVGELKYPFRHGSHLL